MTILVAAALNVALFCFSLKEIFSLHSGFYIHTARKRHTDLQYLSCDFVCINGKCNPTTRSCVCNEGWSGAACDVCFIGKICEWSISRPALSIILPQTGPILPSTFENGSSLRTGVVFAHGRGFQRGKDARYNCLFGGVATEGRWLSNSVVRCDQPPRAHIGKHAFNLVPLGTNAYIPYEVGTIHHYTFYVNCDASSCQGNCLGPLCLCRLYSQSGQQCEISNIETTTNSTVIENDPAITHAQELQPYIAKIPIQSPSSRLTILYTDIDQLFIDSFENTVQWQQPIGSSRPYHISIQVLGTSSRNVLNWTLLVKPSYVPVVENVTLSNTSESNNRIVYGKIQSLNSSDHNKSVRIKKVPITLKVYLDSSTKLVETMQTLSSDDGTFQYEMYPYMGVPGRYSIMSKHPGDDSTDYTFVEWIEEELKVEALQPEILVNERNFTETYRILAENKVLCAEKAGKWIVEVLEPRLFVSIAAFSQSVDLNLYVTFSISPSASQSMKPNTILQLAFNCGFYTAVTTQTLHYSKPVASVVRLNPERLFVSTVNVRHERSTPPQRTLTIDVHMEHLDEKKTASLSNINFSPFRLVWGDIKNLREVGRTVRLWLALESDWNDSSSADGQINIPNSQNPVLTIPYRIRREATDKIAFVLTLKCFTDLAGNNPNSLVDVELFSTNKEQSFSKSVHLNVATSFYPLKTDFFQLKVKSKEFLPFQTVIKITTDNSSLTIGLEPQVGQFFVSDGRDISIRNDESQAKPFAPSLSLHPSVLSLTENAEDMYVNVVYKNGPLNSFLSIQLVGKEEPYILTINNNSSIPALCRGCGYRLPIRLHQNSNPPETTEEEKGCNAYGIPIPFSYTIPGLPQTFYSHTLAVVDAREESSNSKPFMCGKKVELAQKTILVQTCATAMLRQCRRLYLSQPVSTPMCDSQWNNIPDDLLSIHTYAQYLLMAAKCQMFGVNLGLIRDMIRCISTMDFDCPTSEPHVEKSAPLIDPGLFAGQLFNQQFGLVQPVKIGVQSMFPSLSAIDAQLANFPAALQDFLEQLDKLFPSSDLNTILANKEDAWFDGFLKAVSDQSKGGALILQEELENFKDWEKGTGLIARWNETFEDLQGNNINLQFPELKMRISDFRELISRADRLKSIARQFGGENPFSMLHDVLKKMFANLSVDDNQDNPVGSAIVRIQPAKIIEGEEFRIFVSVQNSLEKEALKNIHLNVDFGKEFFGATRNGLKYRVGPVFYSGIASIDSANQLEAKTTLTAEWTVVPVPDYRLTRTVIQTPQIVLSFDLAGQRKIQRLRSPVFTIEPHASVRVLAFAFPTVHREDWQPQEYDNSRPFNVNIDVINSGYSSLEKVEVVEIQPWLVVARNRSLLITADYKFTGVQLDGLDFSETSLNLGPLASSESRHLTIFISTIKETEAIFRNLSLVLLTNHQVLTQFDYRFFLIHDIIDAGYTTFLVSESSQPFPLHYYNKLTSKLVPLHSLQSIEEKQTIQKINGHSYVSILIAYRQLAMNTTVNIPHSVSSAVFGTFRVNSLPESRRNEVFELVRASEMLASNGVMQRRLVPQQLWMDKTANSTVVKFVDLEAVGQGLSLQIFYEFLFGDPEHFKLPYFSQSLYRIQMKPGQFYSQSPKGDPIVISSLKATSPIGAKFNYSLVSKVPDSHFEVVPQTGEIVLTDPLNKTMKPEGMCMNLIAEDWNKHKTVVPVQFFSSLHKTDQECTIFPSSQQESLYTHVFTGNTDSLVRGRVIEGEVPSSTLPSTTLMVVDPSLGLMSTTSGTTWSLATSPKLQSLPPIFTAAISTATTAFLPSTIYTSSVFSIPEAEEEEQGVKKQSVNPDNSLPSASPTIPEHTITSVIYPDQSLHSQQPSSSITVGPPHFSVVTANPLAILPWLWTPKDSVTIQPAETVWSTSPRRVFTASEIPHKMLPVHSTVGSTVVLLNEASDYTVSAVVGTTTPPLTPENEPSIEEVGSSQDMVQTACRQRQLKPIWAVICDLGKTVYKSGNK